MTLPYTAAQATAAHDQWNAMCGHYSIAAATGRPLEDIRTAGVPLKGWMNPTMISQTLRALGVSYMKSSFAGMGDYTTPESARESSEAMLHLVGSDDTQKAILRIQWEGSWLNPGVPKGAAYQRTHYIAIKAGRIMDPAFDPAISLRVGDWMHMVTTNILPQIKGATGYHFTHAWLITPKS